MMNQHYCIRCGNPYSAPDPGTGLCPDCTRLLSQGKPASPTPEPPAHHPPSEIPDWQSGQVLLDTYEVKKLLGEGGMGKVYRVHHKSWDIDLAVKRPKPEIFSKAKGKENFIREAETWIELGLHPHIATCYYVRSMDDIPTLFAECVEGGSLESWIVESKKLYEGGVDKALERILDIAIQFAWGLSYAHEQGLVHQDVKPDNVLMTPEGMAKVTDFGLAKARAMAGEGITPHASPLVSVGGYTPAFCSPEQVQGEKLNHKTDIWSWAVSVLEMFTGGVAWQIPGQYAATFLEEYLVTGAMEAGVPAMPAALAELLQYCFTDDPAERPKDMNEIAALMQECYQQVTGQAYPHPQPKAVELLADNLNNRALSMLDLGKIAEAQLAFQQALQIDPLHPQATYNLGLYNWRSAKITDLEFIKQLRVIRDSNPGDWRPSYLLSLAHLERNDNQKAQSFLDEIKANDRQRREVVSVLDDLVKQIPTSRSLLKNFEKQADQLNALALSRDGRHAITCGNQSFTAWDLSSGKMSHEFIGHQGAVQVACVSKDGRFIVSGSLDRTVRLWDSSTWECLHTYTGHSGGIRAVDISKDGDLIASGGEDRTIRLWERTTGICFGVLEAHKDRVDSIALSEDGSFALSGGLEGLIYLWDVRGRKPIRTFPGHENSVNVIILSADQRFFYSGSSDKTIRLWEVSTGQCLRNYRGYPYGIQSICLSPDGNFLYRGLYVWETDYGQCLHSPDENVDYACVSQDGKTILTGLQFAPAMDNRGRRMSLIGPYQLQLWSSYYGGQKVYRAPFILCQVRETRELLAHQTEFSALIEKAKKAFADGNLISTLCSVQKARMLPGFERKKDALHLWFGLYASMSKKTLLDGWEETVLLTDERADILCVTRDGRCVLSGAKEILQLWDFEKNACIRTIENAGWPRSICLLPDERYAISGGYDKQLHLWDLANGECIRRFEGHTGDITQISLSPDGKWALSISEDRSARLWEISSGYCLRVFSSKDGIPSQICPDGIHAVSIGPTTSVWNLAAGERVSVFQVDWFDRAVLNPQGDRIFYWYPDKLQIRDMYSGTCLQTIAWDWSGERKGIGEMKFSPDGRFLFLSYFVGAISVWDVTTAKHLKKFISAAAERMMTSGDRAITELQISPDARQMVTGSRNGIIRLWHLDWELEEKEPADWNENAKPHLENFLNQHTPYAGTLPQDRTVTEEEITLALTRRGKPAWTEEDFQQLIYTLGCAGYGWLRPEGVRRKLEEMAAR